MNGIGIRRIDLNLFFINCAGKCDNNVKGKNILREEEGWVKDRLRQYLIDRVTGD
jgi:hypothetical protein